MAMAATHDAALDRAAKWERALRAHAKETQMAEVNSADLFDLVHQQLAAFTTALLMEQTGLGESPNDLHAAVCLALCKEIALLGHFVCQREQITPAQWVHQRASYIRWELDHVRSQVPPRHDQGNA